MSINTRKQYGRLRRRSDQFTTRLNNTTVHEATVVDKVELNVPAELLAPCYVFGIFGIQTLTFRRDIFTEIVRNFRQSLQENARITPQIKTLHQFMRRDS